MICRNRLTTTTETSVSDTKVSMRFHYIQRNKTAPSCKRKRSIPCSSFIVHSGGPAALVYTLQLDVRMNRHPHRIHRHWRTVLYATDRGYTISLGQLPFASSASMIPESRHRYGCQNLDYLTIISIILGWLTVAGWIVTFAATSFGVSSLAQNPAARPRKTSPRKGGKEHSFIEDCYHLAWDSRLSSAPHCQS